MLLSATVCPFVASGQHDAPRRVRGDYMIVLGTVGGIVVAYVGVRIVATVVDVVGRWRTGNWDV